jgi:nicotinamidase/pyrazinamidase
MTEQKLLLQEKSALIIIDLQYDFLPKCRNMRQDGALAVPGGNEVIHPISVLANQFDNVILTQDWHPNNHKSLVSNHPGKSPFDTIETSYGPQVLWPDHCVQGTPGADLAIDPWTFDAATMIIRKGTNPDVDSYSAFMENDAKTPTGLGGYLRDRGIEHLFMAGLATDYCVAYSALDARKMGFDVYLYEHACRGIDPKTVEQQCKAMKDAGVTFI